MGNINALLVTPAQAGLQDNRCDLQLYPRGSLATVEMWRNPEAAFAEMTTQPVSETYPNRQPVRYRIPELRSRRMPYSPSKRRVSFALDAGVE